MSLFRTQHDYFKGGAAGQPTNATYVGDWIWIENVSSLAFIVVVPGASNPAATFTLDICNDPDAKLKNDPLHGTANDGQLFQAPTNYPLVAAQSTAANPAGAGAAINTIIQFERAGSAAIPACPRAKWARLRYTRSGGGVATGLTVSVAVKE